MTKFGFFLVALLVSTSSQAGFFDWLSLLFSGPAKDYGAWQCLGCAIPNPGEPTSVVAIPDVSVFIEANNAEIHEGEAVGRWLPDASITVCNASNCLTVYYRAGTSLWLPKGPSSPIGNRKPRVPKHENPINKRQIEVSFEGPAPAVDEFARRYGGAVEAKAEHWAVPLTDPKRELQQLLACVEALDLPMRQLHVRRASLEDVFLHRTGRSLRD